MKKIFVYFDNIAMCENTQQAVEFINSLPGLTCNQHTVKLLNDLFEGKKDYYGEDIKSLATTGCGKSRIRIYDALGETLEKHQEEYIKREQEKHHTIEKQRCKVMMEKAKESIKKFKEASIKRHGKYEISLKIWYYNRDKISGLFPIAATEDTFILKTTAESGIDAYNKAIESVLNQYDVVDYVTITDNGFKYKFIG